ncbi:disulfide bond formation protein DsbA [Piscirickettsia salmonis]|uniref:DsbA family protein n=1 Tax=Piscirickettsia salmonis TaxID=1238 RepID=UPI0002EF7087|nr:DsbA family protein [Piscirickettsia salmonis]ALA24820.1 DSBA-like thioredoxin domain protein [Piscirickettsia salmonis]APS45144.1 disulfide bond formation protein DsbA [Piscirickettsia salmonis]APS48504.1 disulfide bond formation protein DsbA [Piscirickettsia salmonis]APS49766.1 disulfide bond formation protein DsbA [Piscirickettsia salmonis]APS52949.1 disulfide bond formation protein DsbA [Piscirickettsia salmonis]
MKKYLFASLSLVTPFVLSNAFAANTTTFTAAQQEKIGEIAAQYIINHPEVLIQAGQKLQQQQMKAQEKQQITAVLHAKKQLLSDPKTPTVGPSNAKVAVVEFFDYQCVFCSKVAPAIEKIMKDNPKVKFVFKDFPIFGQRWPTSTYAAEVGLVAYKQGGAKMYMNYHNGIYATGKDEGKLTNKDVDMVAKKAGVDLTKDKTLLSAGKTPPPSIQANFQLAGEALGLRGTPALVIMPTSGANEKNVTVFAGYPANPQGGTAAAVTAIQQAIDKASQ